MMGTRNHFPLWTLVFFFMQICEVMSNEKTDEGFASGRIISIGKKIEVFNQLIERNAKQRTELLKLLRDDLISDVAVLQALVDRKLIFWDEAYGVDQKRSYYDRRKEFIALLSRIQNALSGFDERLPKEFAIGDQIQLVEEEIAAFEESAEKKKSIK